ncbi:hypothetical protein BD410DRAFT_793274 [Rickenella mellea]|uniref:Uncharacterized protein n=1 Tax=Rickenella mellea TaxID=50990 RepID=A0A4Y7PUX1_9AGAM|nr:hypothetical protein BD410DRAFT_793274 [Rickenella mellea]
MDTVAWRGHLFIIAAAALIADSPTVVYRRLLIRTDLDWIKRVFFGAVINAFDARIF